MKPFSLVFLFVFLLLFYVELDAQVNRGISAAGRRMDDFDNQRRRAERDAMGSEMRGRKPSKEELKRAAQLKTETREDLEGLQQRYNEIVTNLSGGHALDRALFAEATARVNKHAHRLKANIVFPKPETEYASELPVTADVRRRLRELCTRIFDFLTNPMIDNPNVLDLEAAHKARELLDSIIALSEPAANS